MSDLNINGRNSPPISSSIHSANIDPYLEVVDSEDGIHLNDFSSDLDGHNTYTSEFRHTSFQSHSLRERALGEIVLNPQVERAQLHSVHYELTGDAITPSEQLIDPLLQAPQLPNPKYIYSPQSCQLPESSSTPESSRTNISSTSPLLTETKNHILKYFIDEILPWVLRYSFRISRMFEANVILARQLHCWWLLGGGPSLIQLAIQPTFVFDISIIHATASLVASAT